VTIGKTMIRTTGQRIIEIDAHFRKLAEDR
jgi:hypothetical protein